MTKCKLKYEMGEPIGDQNMLFRGEPRGKIGELGGNLRKKSPPRVLGEAAFQGRLFEWCGDGRRVTQTYRRSQKETVECYFCKSGGKEGMCWLLIVKSAEMNVAHKKKLRWVWVIVLEFPTLEGIMGLGGDLQGPCHVLVPPPLRRSGDERVYFRGRQLEGTNRRARGPEREREANVPPVGFRRRGVGTDRGGQRP